MNGEIDAYEGWGPLRYGMTRKRVHEVLGSPGGTFRRDPAAQEVTDAYPDRGLFVCYGANDLCEALELVAPAFVSLAGEALLGQPYAEVLALLRRHDPQVATDASGATAYSLGLGVYAPHAAKDPDAVVECAIAFRRGYYDATAGRGWSDT